MSALPNATSQGSNAAGGGAFSALALTAISAAKAEPDTNASAVANKAIFFMTKSPHQRSTRSARSGRPPRPGGDCNQFLDPPQFGTRDGRGEAKKSGICRLFEL